MAEFIVSGPHRVDEVSPGEVIDLGLEEARTKRLVASGAVTRKPKRPARQPDSDSPAAGSGTSEEV